MKGYVLFDSRHTRFVWGGAAENDLSITGCTWACSLSDISKPFPSYERARQKRRNPEWEILSWEEAVELEQILEL